MAAPDAEIDFETPHSARELAVEFTVASIAPLWTSHNGSATDLVGEAPPARFEPATNCLEGSCSIR